MCSLSFTVEVILPSEYLIHTHTIQRDSFRNIPDTDILEIVLRYLYLYLSEIISVGRNPSLFFFMTHFNLFYEGFVCIKVVSWFGFQLLTYFGSGLHRLYAMKVSHLNLLPLIQYCNHLFI